MKNEFGIKKILIAVENSSYSEKASAYGFAMARKMNAEVAILHVTEMPAAIPYVSDPLFNEPQLIVPEVMNAQEEAGINLLDKVKARLGDGLQVSVFHKIGNTAEEIIAVAEEWHADLLVLGTHGRTGIDHFLSGSVAESAVRAAKCAVLVVPVNN